jgi:hypothetical protein
MITAQFILEEYKTSLKTNLGYCEVFVNPDQKELRGCGNYIRFTADGYRKDIYVWTYDTALHRDVLPALDMLHRENLVWCIHGTAQFLGGKYGMIDSDSLNTMSVARGAVKKLLGSLLSLDWSWTLHYHVDLERYLNSLRQT